MVNKICTICKTSKDASEFSKNRHRKDGLQTKCKECSKRISKDYYNKNHEHRKKLKESNIRKRKRDRKFLFDYLASHPCVDCGEDNPIVLEFDHVSGKKLGCISKMIESCSIDVVKSEMEKCEVRCANCHRIKTAKDMGYYKEWVRS